MASTPRDTGLESEAEPPVGDTPSPKRERVVAAARIAAGCLLFVLVIAAAARDWREVRDTLGQLSASDLVVSELLVLAGIAASVLTWRLSLRELGTPTRVAHAAKIYCVGQLGKYLPGSFWAFLVQMEMARKVGAPRSSALAASVVAAGINVLVGLAIGLFVIPRAWGHTGWWYSLAAAGAVVCAVSLSPPVLTWLVNTLMRLVKRPRLSAPVTWEGVLQAVGWATVNWLAFGLSVWVLAIGVGAPAGESFLLCLTAVALAMTAGFVVFIAPSGIGVREAVMVAGLSPVLDTGEALSVVLVARLVFTLADIIAATASLPVRLKAPNETMAA